MAHWSSTRGGSTAATGKSARPFRLGPWTVQPALNRLVRADEVVQLEPLVTKVLVYLSSRPGEVFSREEILRDVWGEAIVCEDALTRVISELRRVLGDDPKDPRFIETIRKGGYRLVVPVLAPAEDGGMRAPAPELATTPTPPLGISLPRSFPRWAAIVLAAVALLAAVTIWRGASVKREASPVALAFIESVPLTAYAGEEHHPAISPDGLRVAFAWDGDAGAGYDIHIAQIDSDATLRLTDHPDEDVQPAWSPAGDRVAFVRRGKDAGIYTIPAIGGEETRLLAAWEVGPGLDWSPDGRWLAFAGPDSMGGPLRIKLLDVETREVRGLSQPVANSTGDCMAAFSPDGRALAFCRGEFPLARSICLMPLAGGEVRRLTGPVQSVIGIDWLPGGDELVYSAAYAEEYCLWRVAVAGGQPVPIPTKSDIPIWPSVSRQRERLVYEHLAYERDIYTLERDGRVRDIRDLEPIIGSTRDDAAPAFSPDGRTIAFLSWRSGQREMWICDADGANQRRLTHFAGAQLLPPRWSPAGDELACTVLRDGYYRLYRIDPAEGHPRPVLAEARHQILIHWSRHGDWLYYLTHDDGDWSTWRVTPDGARCEAYLPVGAAIIGETDERLVYVTGPEEGILAAPHAGGPGESLLRTAAMAAWSNLLWTESGLYYTVSERSGTCLVCRDLVSARGDTLLRLPRYSSLGLAVERGTGTLALHYADGLVRDLMFVEGFH